jgi:DNA-binding transcriptional regulator LsrR (DeoR family)
MKSYTVTIEKTLYKKGYGQYYIAKTLNIGHTTVAQNLKKAGIKMRGHRDAANLSKGMNYGK